MLKIELSAKRIIMVVVTLFIIGAILAIGLVSVSVIGEQVVNIGGVNYTVSDVLDPTVLTLLTTLLPILVVIGIAMYFIPKAS